LGGAAALSAALLAVTSVAWAEAPIGCNDEGDYHQIEGWHGANDAWVEFYSAPRTPAGPHDTWTLRHCRTGWQVSVSNLTPFDFPSDNPDDPPPPGWLASEGERKLIWQVMRDDLPRGGARRVAESLAERISGLGLSAEPGRVPFTSCVCDPVWRE
jgi:hypothetical protein